MDILIAELIEFVKNASPVVWQIFMKQVYMQAVGYFVWGVGCVFAIGYGIKLLSRLRKLNDEGSSYEDYDFVIGLTIASLCILPIVTLSLFTSTVLRLVNADYYAIQMLLGIVQ